MLKKLKIIIDGNVFEFEGDGTIPFADVFKLAGEFLQATLQSDQAKIDALAQRGKHANEGLQTAVDAATS